MYKLGPILPTHLPFHPLPPNLPTVMMIETRIIRKIMMSKTMVMKLRDEINLDDYYRIMDQKKHNGWLTPATVRGTL